MIFVTFDICSNFDMYFFSQTLIGKSKKDIKKVCPFSNIGNRIGKSGEKVLESIKLSFRFYKFFICDC
jgi:hypothetical protein